MTTELQLAIAFCIGASVFTLLISAGTITPTLIVAFAIFSAAFLVFFIWFLIKGKWR